MQPCKQYELDIPLYVTGDLESPQAERLAEHLTECDACRHHYQEMQRLIDLLHPEAVTVDPAYGSELLVALNERIHRSRSPIIRWRQVLAYASGLLVLVTTIFMVQKLVFTKVEDIAENDVSFTDLLKIGYFAELPLHDNEEDLSDHDLFFHKELVTSAAASFLEESRYLPVENFIEVTTPLEETEFKALVEYCANEPF